MKKFNKAYSACMKGSNCTDMTLLACWILAVGILLGLGSVNKRGMCWIASLILVGTMVPLAIKFVPICVKKCS